MSSPRDRRGSVSLRRIHFDVLRDQRLDRGQILVLSRLRETQSGAVCRED